MSFSTCLINKFKFFLLISKVSLDKIKLVNALIALCKISCSFLINCALAKSNAVMFFCRVKSLPKSLNEAISISKQNNPDIQIAKFDLAKAEKELAISESDLKPTASVSLERSYTDDLSSTYDEREKDVLKATVSWPFYSGGKKRSTISKNSNLTTRKRLLLDDAVRTNDTNVASAWSSLESSESFLNSVKVQVRASQIANEGIAAEYERGSRTTLDVIQSNALLLSAQISLASSERNYLMAQYNLLKAVGLLNSQYLKLK